MAKVAGLLALACLVSIEASAAPSAVSQRGIFERLDKAAFNAAQRAEIERAITDSQILVLRSLKASESKVIGGVPASRGQFPWMAALLVEDSFGNRFQFCGGSLIAPNKVLTAAHCNIYPPAAVRVMVNEIKLVDGAQRAVPIKTFESHENFASADTGFDVAVITLKSNIQGITPASLTPPEPADGDTLALGRIMGWGATQEGGEGSDVLMHAAVPFVSNERCKKAYPEHLSSMVCAGRNEGGTDTCQGDSGGPLFLIGPQQSLSQVGIVSFGQGCARAGFYGVYTRVSSFREWILAH